MYSNNQLIFSTPRWGALQIDPLQSILSKEHYSSAGAMQFIRLYRRQGAVVAIQQSLCSKMYARVDALRELGGGGLALPPRCTHFRINSTCRSKMQAYVIHSATKVMFTRDCFSLVLNEMLVLDNVTQSLPLSRRNSL